tara:strand:+ start:3773 stop:5326 length:1554 start_codon:yes stop_codon:yes gene_type:complete
MTLIIIQNPISQENLVWIPIWWRKHLIVGIGQDSDISALYKYKFVLALYLDSTSGTQIAKIKQPWNGYETSSGVNRRTFFDIKEIVASYVSFTTQDSNNTDFEDDKAIHSLGMNNPNKIYGHSNNIVRKIAFKAWVEYSATVNGVPTEDTSDTVNNTNYFQNATAIQPPEATMSEMNLNSQILDVYNPSGTSSKLLTDADYTDAKVNIKYDFSAMQSSGSAEDLRFNTTKYVQFINQQDRSTIAYRPATKAKLFKIELFHSAGDMNDTITSDGTTGGSASPVSDETRILHFGCGPRNFQSCTNWDSGNTDLADKIASGDWYYYTIQTQSTGGLQGTALYYFVNGKYANDNMGCNIWNRALLAGDNTSDNLSYVRLGWINSLGTWDYFNFACKNTETIEIKERIDMQTPRGIFNEAYYTERATALTHRSLSIEAKRKMTLHTGYLSDGEGKYLQWLLKSPLVHFVCMGEQDVSGNNFMSCPVKLDTKSLVKKTKLNDGVKTNYTFDIEFINKESVVAR